MDIQHHQQDIFTQKCTKYKTYCYYLNDNVCNKYKEYNTFNSIANIKISIPKEYILDKDVEISMYTCDIRYGEIEINAHMYIMGKFINDNKSNGFIFPPFTFKTPWLIKLISTDNYYYYGYVPKICIKINSDKMNGILLKCQIEYDKIIYDSYICDKLIMNDFEIMYQNMCHHISYCNSFFGISENVTIVYTYFQCITCKVIIDSKYIDLRSENISYWYLLNRVLDDYNKLLMKL